MKKQETGEVGPGPIPAPASVEEQKDDTKAVWQFKYRNYHYVLPIKDESAQRTPTGVLPNVVLKVRDWKVVLNLKDKRGKYIHEYLEGSDRLDIDFWRLVEVDRDDTVKDRALTLERLFDMEYGQLSGMLTAEEYMQAGLVPGRARKAEIIMAIIDNKKLEGRKE